MMDPLTFADPQDNDLTLREAQNEVHRWIQTIGVRYFNELTNLAILTEEVGELARILARRYGEQSEKPSDAAGTSATKWPTSSGCSWRWPTRPAST